MAIIGLDLFSKHFTEHREKFVLIGGSACHLNLEEQWLKFRTTKNIAIVLLLDIEILDTQFTKCLWDFIKMTGYTIKYRSSGKPVFFRFEKPEDKNFPVMIEGISGITADEVLELIRKVYDVK